MANEQKRYRIAKMVAAGSLALVETFSILFGTGCAPSNQNTNTSTNNTAVTETTERDELLEITAITKEDARKMSIEELENAYNLTDKKERKLSKALKEMEEEYAFGQLDYTNSIITRDYLLSSGDLNDKDVKNRLAELNKTIADYEITLPPLKTRIDQYIIACNIAINNMAIYYNVMQEKYVEQYENGK